MRSSGKLGRSHHFTDLFPAGPGVVGGGSFFPTLILKIATRLFEEEKFLSANLNGYEAYQQQVRYRLIPFIW
jgi:protein-S-isoprenylcysteine O-methyltransferase Ste14